MKPKAYRKLMGWTLEQYSKKAGISVSFACMIERGERRPGPEKAKRIQEMSGGAITLEDQLFNKD